VSNGRAEISTNASTTVLPVTITSASSIPSARRFARAEAVGAKCRSAMMLTTRRFISSGNG
jgi:hypothetical protein